MLELAINHPEFAGRIREHRVRPPEERTVTHKIEAIQAQMAEVGEYTAKNRARLEAALDDLELLSKLEVEWLSDEERFRFGVWPGDEAAFRVSPEADAIRDFIVRFYRKDLAGWRIVCLFQDAIPPVKRRGRLGTMLKLPGKARFLTAIAGDGFHGAITLDFGHWCSLTDQDRQRLVHHELMHVEVQDGRLVERTHDFEDFADVVLLYGIRSESGRFSTDGKSAEALEHVTSQLELLGRAG